MTIPCVKDTQSVAWIVDTGGVLDANVQVSKDSTNAITLSAAGLLADYARRDLFRYRNTVNVAVTTGAQTSGSGGGLVAQFISPVGLVALTPNTSGLYHLTGICSWATSAAGTFRSLVIAVGSVQYPDVIISGGTGNAFSANQFVNCFDGIVPINAGQTLSMLFQQDTGGTINVLAGSERIGIEVMANLLMEV